MSHQGYTTPLRRAVEESNLGVVPLERLGVLHSSSPSRVCVHCVLIACNIGELCSTVGINLHLMMMSESNAYIACYRELPTMVLDGCSTCEGF